MRLASSLFVVVFALLASCGAGPEGPEDTEGVAAGPRSTEPPEPSTEAAPPLPPPPAAVGPSLPGDAAPTIGFSADRFVLYAHEGEPSFLVFDRTTNATFRVLGQPMGDAAPASDRFEQIGLARGARRLRPIGDAYGRLLVRSPGGVQLVDLGDGGRMIAAWRGTPIAASIAPDGTTFTVVAEGAIVVVRARDGAYARYPAAFEEPPALRWAERFVSFVAGGTLTRVDRETLRAPVVAVVSQGKDGKPGTVALHADGSPTPILRVASPTITQLTIDDAGSTIVWFEREEDPEGIRDEGWLHAIDVASRTHVRFRGKGSGCAIAPEMLEAVKDGKIVTDASCSLGCPSVRWTHRTVTYDAKTGRVLDDASVTEQKSYNEEQAELQARIEASASKLAVETKAMLHRPNEDAVLVERPAGAAIVALGDAPPVELEASKDASLAALTFSEDGAIVAGVVGGRARAWDAATGRALLR